MVTEQHMAQAIMQTVIKATKATIWAVIEADTLVNNTRTIHAMPN